MKFTSLLLLFALAEEPGEYRPEFRDIAATAGLSRAFPNGGMTSKKFIIETTGSGVAMIDVDNDGLLDLFIGSGDGERSRLYHNDGQNHFRDISDEYGLT